MSRRRRDNEPPVTLFSFQDIITSVSGVLILVTLMMVLDLINRHSSSAATAAPAPVSEALVQDDAHLQSEIETLQAQMDRAQERVRTVSQINFAEIPLLLDKETMRKQALDQEVRDLTASLDTARYAQSQGEARKAQLSQRISQLEKELQQIKSEPANRVTFANREPTDKTPVLVECSHAGVRVKICAEPPRIQSFIDPASVHYASSIRKFKEWTAALSHSKYAFVVLIKPSACAYGPALVGELRDLDYDVGYEPLEEEKDAVF